MGGDPEIQDNFLDTFFGDVLRLSIPCWYFCIYRMTPLLVLCL